MSAPINTPIASVMALTRSDCATRGCIIAAVICGCWAAFLSLLSVKHRGDVASNTWPCLMCFLCHLTFLFHSAYTPSRCYPLTSFAHTGDINDAGRSSSSVPRWTEHAHNFFFFINQSIDHVRAEPKILIRTDTNCHSWITFRTCFHKSDCCLPVSVVVKQNGLLLMFCHLAPLFSSYH